MTTLLLRLCGPMQAWGTQSRFKIRDTGREPSKSGVVGLLCAALGWPRDRDVTALSSLTMGVRVDREGTMLRDYHTVGGSHLKGERYGVVTAEGSLGGTVVSQRYYLADADFLVGLEGDAALLHEAEEALANPVWPIFLGRKAFVPGLPVRLPDDLPRGPGIREEPLADLLATYPWFPDPARGRPGRPDGPPPQLRTVIETAPAPGAEVRMDQPVGAAFRDRTFTVRHVVTGFVPSAGLVWEGEGCTSRG
ncbi:MAG: type I-E CRISPR-associated protein Cas5/CasD [Gemmataceae bacterium]|nr:type I-E CRISPR-associated protein Cas5/CasD [Gemmataceae bacterium]